MRIDNLSKDLDSKALETVHGGVAVIGQVVPTNIQSNQMAQDFNIGSKAPVAIGNEGYQSNYSSQPTIAPVGSLFVTPSWCDYEA
jgi:hypothetical protein